MREILFRGKRIDNGKWHYGSYLFLKNASSYDWTGKKSGKREDIHFIVDDSDLNYSVDPSTVGQYTGLTDKNGRKIFEGDIVRCGGNLVVAWNEKFAGWCLTKEGWLYNHFFGEACEPEDCEVVGNIFDNPELIN